MQVRASFLNAYVVAVVGATSYQHYRHGTDECHHQWRFYKCRINVPKEEELNMPHDMAPAIESRIFPSLRQYILFLLHDEKDNARLSYSFILC